MTYEDAVDLILAELWAADAKHGPFPDDVVHAAAIVGEESGELLQASIDHHFCGGAEERLKTEAAQTAAMGLKFLLWLEPREGNGVSGERLTDCDRIHNAFFTLADSARFRKPAEQIVPFEQLLEWLAEAKAVTQRPRESPGYNCLAEVEQRAEIKNKLIREAIPALVRDLKRARVAIEVLNRRLEMQTGERGAAQTHADALEPIE